MTIATRITAIAAVWATSMLTGCAVGPDFVRPSPPAVEGYTPETLAATTASADTMGGAAQRFVQDKDIPGQWWTLYRSAPLNTLIEEALKANPTLDAAKAALRQAQELVYAEQGALFPTVTGNISTTREKFSGASFGFAGSEIFNLHTASLNVSYPLDVFGGTRRQIESLAAQTEFEGFQLEAAYLSLTANVVTAAVTEASLRGQIAATKQIIDIESQEVELLKRQFELGGQSRAAVLAQQATLEQTRATLPPLEKQLAQQRNLLSNLVGRFPSQEPSETFDLAGLQLPEELPVSLPSKLVEQRPDIRSAEAQLHAASAEIGVAIANQLPQVTLSAQIGNVATGALFGPGTGIWSLGASVAQTVFDAGTLQHQKRATIAAFDQAAAQYRTTVLAAFQDVANALRALQADADALQAQVAAEQTAADSLAITREQFRVGAVTYLSLLTAEQTYQQALLNRVQAQANRFSDTAALFQALGGGWWHRDDIPVDNGASNRLIDAVIP